MKPAVDGGEASTSAWSDAPTRASLQVVAEGVALLSGFRHAVINVRRGEVLEVVATSLSELRELMGTTIPVRVLEQELDRADVWGDLRFVPHDRVGDEVLHYSFVPDLDPVEGPEGWHPLDLLAVPFYDDEGTLRGLLTVDAPVDGKRPGPAQREVLARYADVTRTSLLLALEREELEQRVRLMTEVRELVRRALGEPSLELVVAACRSALVQSFGAAGLWLSAFSSDGALSSTWYSEGGHDRPHFEELGDLAVRLARRYWDEQYVAHFSRSHGDNPCLTDDEATLLVEFLDGIGTGSLLFVPLGAGAECLGFLVLSRVSDEAAWTTGERDAALDIGHDLGRAVANARQLETERALVARLRELDLYRAELINTMAHEIRSPLTAVVGNVEMVELDEQLSETGKRSVEAALRGARRIDRVIEDLLVVARVSDPQAPFLPVEVDLRATVLEAVEECGHVASARGITVTTEIPPSPVVVPGRPDELHRVLANLLSNAIKYSDEGGQVEIRLEPRAHLVALTVVDQGLGISEKDQGNLFREFDRSSNPEAIRRPGTGLGLVIVERIVRRHGGDIEVDSELGRGTTTSVTLPSGIDR